MASVRNYLQDAIWKRAHLNDNFRLAFSKIPYQVSDSTGSERYFRLIAHSLHASHGAEQLGVDPPPDVGQNDDPNLRIGGRRRLH